jgi:F-type H+-transporting ATPase subunit b
MNGLQTGGLQIDLFTTAAQIINFLILLYLLRRFLYRPVLKLMDDRETLIFSRLKEAEETKKEAEKEAESYRQKKEVLSSEHEEMLIKAKEDAKNFKAELIRDAREEVEETKAEWYEDVRREREAFLEDLRKRAGEQIYAITRRALRDLADEELESRIIDTFIKRLQNLDESEKETLKDFYGSLEQPITVRSAFEIPRNSRDKIEEVLRNQSGSELRVQFQIDEELISGIEMSARNLEISWSIDGYLGSLEADFSRLLEERTLQERAG